MSDPWLSNTYVVADELGGSAVMVDAGGPVAPLWSTSTAVSSTSRTCC